MINNFMKIDTGKIFGLAILLTIALLMVFTPKEKQEKIETLTLSFNISYPSYHNFYIEIENKSVKFVKIRKNSTYVIVYPEKRIAMGTECGKVVSSKQCFERFERLVRDIETGVISLEELKYWKYDGNKTAKGIECEEYENPPAKICVYVYDNTGIIVEDNIETNRYPWKHADYLNIRPVLRYQQTKSR